MPATDHQKQTLKRLLWLYFWLLIFEGALRKWVVPQLSTPLLVIRDPLVLVIYALALARGIFPRNGFVAVSLVLAVLGFMASWSGIGTLKVTLFGLHANFLHLPLIFLIPEIFDAEDAKKIGKWVLALSIPMALLVFVQFRASPSAWINAAAGGERGGQLYAAMGKIRPPGVFSFVTGMVSYLTLVAAYLSYQFLDPKIYPRWLVYPAILAVVLSVGISGSRSAVVGVVLVFIMLVFVCIRRGKVSTSGMKYVFAIALVCLAMSFVPAFRLGLRVQEERFEASGGVHEGIVDRFFGELVSSLDACSYAPLFGMGLGIGTNAGAGLLSGERQFLLAEGEWGRVILESGPILGMAFIVLRFGILAKLLSVSMRSLRQGYALPLLLLSTVGIDVVTGQFGQPTELGFVIFISGLCLIPVAGGEGATREKTAPETSAAALKMRGRSAYAETLHGETTNTPAPH